jgi:hypothetical protein
MTQAANAGLDCGASGIRVESPPRLYFSFCPRQSRGRRRRLQTNRVEQPPRKVPSSQEAPRILQRSSLMQRT